MADSLFKLNWEKGIDNIIGRHWAMAFPIASGEFWAFESTQNPRAG